VTGSRTPAGRSPPCPPPAPGRDPGPPGWAWVPRAMRRRARGPRRTGAGHWRAWMALRWVARQRWGGRPEGAAPRGRRPRGGALSPAGGVWDGGRGAPAGPAGHAASVSCALGHRDGGARTRAPQARPWDRLPPGGGHAGVGRLGPQGRRDDPEARALCGQLARAPSPTRARCRDDDQGWGVGGPPRGCQVSTGGGAGGWPAHP
jgi:hypothetical protein